MRNKIHWTSVILAYSTLFILGLSDNIRGPLFPDVIQDLGLSDTRGSLFWAGSSMMAFVASVLSAQIIRFLGAVGSLRLSLFFMASGQLAMSISNDFTTGLLSCFLIGASFGILGVVQNLLVLQAGPASSIQRLQAGLHSNYALASFAAPLFLSLMHYFKPGWRFGYAMGGAVSFVAFLILFFISSKEFQSEKSQKQEREFKENIKNSDRIRALYFGSILAIYVLIEIMVSSRLALYLRRNFSYDFEQANLAVTLFFVGLLLGRVLFIFWKPNKSLKVQLIISMLLTFLSITIGLQFFPIFLAVSGLTMAPFYPLAMSYIGEKFPNQLGMATSITISLIGLFVVFMHFGIGSLTDNFGIHFALWLGPIACLVATVMLVFDEKFH